ncbi:MAG: hypothetical protein OXE50_11105 [Chloroflexi bacterium]|nr:hypothetical protein [Chloroflexota bacterium]
MPNMMSLTLVGASPTLTSDNHFAAPPVTRCSHSPDLPDSVQAVSAPEIAALMMNRPITKAAA